VAITRQADDQSLHLPLDLEQAHFGWRPIKIVHVPVLNPVRPLRVALLKKRPMFRFLESDDQVGSPEILFSRLHRVTDGAMNGHTPLPQRTHDMWSDGTYVEDAEFGGQAA
jgi:hypothetical protein